VPQAVAGGFPFTDLVLGQDHSCGIRSNGETLCWGWNNYGTLGDGTFDRRGVPTTVSGSHSFTDLGAWNHTCGVTAGNSLYCWGLNDRGQLGLGHTSSAFTPGIVTGGLTFLTPPPE
jgi:alpha-tubulin suppressor-like RCC1 family protein